MLVKIWNSYREIAGGNINDINTVGKNSQFLMKLNMYLPFDPVIPFLGILLKRNKNIFPQKDKYKNVHSTFIHKKQKLEKPQCP